MSVLFFTLFLGILILSEVLHIRGVHGETTRKVVHVSAAGILCFFPWIFTIHQGLAIATVLFVFFAILESYKLFPSITDIDRESVGGIAFVVGVALAAVLVSESEWFPFQVALLILAISDTAAALVGQRFPDLGKPDEKTLVGSTVFFVLTLSVIVVSFFWIGEPFQIMSFLSVVFFSAALTLVERYSAYGLDNLFLPVLATMMLSVLF